MMRRRDFLARTLGGSSLFAVGAVVPEFLAATARAADRARPGDKDTILVVVEMTGGNDGLNMVAPYGDDLYHKARPTLALSKKEVLKLDDLVGLHPRMGGLKQLFDDKKLAVVQGVGYPNPDRSHFESMDIWQLGDPKRAKTSGWLARTIPNLTKQDGGLPGLYLGQERLPTALQGADGAVVTLGNRDSFKLELSGDVDRRKKLIADLNAPDPALPELGDFVRKRQLSAYASLERIEQALKETDPKNPGFVQNGNQGLQSQLGLIARMIGKGLGTRIYYTSIAGFDTHADQAKLQGDLLEELSAAISGFFGAMNPADADRVALITYSEFGRRVKENGSRGTDHGAASCLFVAGPKVKGGVVGKHPRLDDLDDGDIKFQIDFRRVYAALLDEWLGVESRLVLGERFDPLPLFDKTKPATTAGIQVTERADLQGRGSATRTIPIPTPVPPPVPPIPPAKD